MSHPPDIHATSDKRNESDAWLANYADDVQRARRLRLMPDKLALLGLLDAPRDVALVDLCCGHGEALHVLHGLGFKNLNGVDITVTKELAAETRFKVLQGDACDTKLPAAAFDWVICIHSMHHFASADNVARFVDEAHRLLKPGGRLAIVDFPASLQIRAAFWFFRHFRWAEVTPYLRYFGNIVREEWWFLKDYLPQWPRVRRLLWNGRFEVERDSRTLFYFHLTLRKPAE